MTMTPPASGTTRTPPPNLAALQHELANRAAWKAGVIGALNVAIAIVAVRLIVLIAVVGGIGLTWVALDDATPYRLAAVAIYALFVTIPVVWLASR